MLRCGAISSSGPNKAQKGRLQQQVLVRSYERENRVFVIQTKVQAIVQGLITRGHLS